MGVRGCVKNSKINKLEKENTKLEASVDSLNNLVMSPEQKKTVEWSYGIDVYNLVNDEISKLDKTNGGSLYRIVVDKDAIGDENYKKLKELLPTTNFS
jgi:hypothetical protein